MIEKIITLDGACPSKKNLYRRGRSGGLYLDRDVKAKLDFLTFQAARQWPEAPVIHPDVDIQFYVLDQRTDRDNRLGALLDCLQKAGVIKNDNIKNFNGTVTILPAILAVRERTILKIRGRQ